MVVDGLIPEDEAWAEALLQDPRFTSILERAKREIKAGNFVAFEDIDFENL